MAVLLVTSNFFCLWGKSTTKPFYNVVGMKLTALVQEFYIFVIGDYFSGPSCVEMLYQPH